MIQYAVPIREAHVVVGVVRFPSSEEAAEFCSTMGIRPWIRPVVVGCERCESNDFGDVPHDNCIRPGAVGHSRAHCTASACF